MFTPLEFAAVGLTEERACQLYGDDSVEVYMLNNSAPLVTWHKVTELEVGEMDNGRHM